MRKVKIKNCGFEMTNTKTYHYQFPDSPCIQEDLSLKIYNFSHGPIFTDYCGYYEGMAEIAVPAEVLLDLGATHANFVEAVQNDVIQELTASNGRTAHDNATNIASLTAPEIPKFSGVRLPVIWPIWSEIFWTKIDAKYQAIELNSLPRKVNEFIALYLPAHDETLAAYEDIPQINKGSLERMDFRICAAYEVLNFAQRY